MRKAIIAATLVATTPLLQGCLVADVAGVAIGVEPLVSGLLNDGRLTGLATNRLRSARSFFLLEPPTPSTRAGRLLRDWLWRQAHG
jgi:LysR family glycine cleavage system transcriptional activator